MNWTEIMKVAAPAMIGAGSAILSAWLTHLFAERRHRREMESKTREMRQRLLESLVPQRIFAYQQVFILINRLKKDTDDTANILEEMTPHLMWIEPSLAEGIVSSLKTTKADSKDFASQLSALQNCLRDIAGVCALERYFADTRL